jgi:predicted flap endonuclease-1-like 5' DNA nuclease
MAAVVRKDGQARLASLLDVPEWMVLQWARQANLMRVAGVGFEEAGLLQDGGVATLEALGGESREGLVERQPGLADCRVEEWIAQARTLRDVV